MLNPLGGFMCQEQTKLILLWNIEKNSRKILLTGVAFWYTDCKKKISNTFSIDRHLQSWNTS